MVKGVRKRKKCDEGKLMAIDELHEVSNQPYGPWNILEAEGIGVDGENR